MKLTKAEASAIARMQERLDNMKVQVAKRAYLEKCPECKETDTTIEGLEAASAGIEQALEQFYSE